MRASCFTLVEVIVALAVLALGVLSVSLLLGAAQKRCQTAIQLREEQHVLGLAAEYYLLASVDVPPDARIIGRRDYRIAAEYVPLPPDALPPDCPDQDGGLRLVMLRLQLYRKSDGELLRALEIFRIVGGNGA